MDLNKIAAIVVLYQPENDNDVITNILSYLSQVHKVYIIDNSIYKISDNLIGFFNATEKIVYVPLGENKGIAYALNKGCLLATKDEMEWVLTMDQDTFVDSSLIDIYREAYLEIGSDKIGIISPNVDLLNTDTKIENNNIELVDSVITSASLMNLSAYEEVGGFDDTLFIDWVDWDICFRLSDFDYSILRVNKTRITHQLGETRELKLFSKHILYITNHNYIRYYYKTRNALFLSEKYKNKNHASVFLKKSIVSDFFKIVFFEKDKSRKIKSFIKAYNDYKNKRMGKASI